LAERDSALYSVDHSDIRICGDGFLSSRPEILRLLEGLPHALVLTNPLDEPEVFVPLVRPERPAIAAAPLSTELVIRWRDWAYLDVKHLTLPVHMSMAYLTLQTLTSSMYMLLLRLLGRDLVDTQRLVGAVGTDAELSAEERAIVRAISDVDDQCPDAVALDVHLATALSDAPLHVQALLGVDLPRLMVDYINKRSRVSLTSLVEREVELEAVIRAARQLVMEEVIIGSLNGDKTLALEVLMYLRDTKAPMESSLRTRLEMTLEGLYEAIERALSEDPGSVDEEVVKDLIPTVLLASWYGREWRPNVELVLVRNRRTWLEAEAGATVTLESPAVTPTGNWQFWTSRTAVDDPITHLALNLMLNREEVEMPARVRVEDVTGAFGGPVQAPDITTIIMAFSLLMGHLSVKNMDAEEARLLGQFFLHDRGYYGGGGDSFWSSLCSLLTHSRALVRDFPRFPLRRPARTKAVKKEPARKPAVARGGRTGGARGRGGNRGKGPRT
jgi:hypothetical protein